MFQRALLSLSFLGTVVLGGCLGGGGGGGGAGVPAPPLEDLQYTQAAARYATRLPITPNVATLGSGEADTFTIDPALPSGLELDPVTGEITGTPDEAIETTDFVVTASNDQEMVSTTISIEVVTITAALGGAETDSARAVAGLEDGGFLVTGSFRGDVEIGDLKIISDQGSTDIFVARFDADGTVKWVKTAGGAGTDSPSGIATFEGDEGFVVTGSFSEVALFGAGEPNQTFLVSDEASDIFVARFDRRGELEWVKRAGGGGVDRGQSIATFSDGESVVVGTFFEDVTFGPGEANETIFKADSQDAFLARFSKGGKLIWAKQAAGSGLEELRSVAATPKGAAVAAGFFTNSVQIDKEAEKATGSQDALIVRLSSQGKLEWMETAGGKDFDIANADAVAAFSDESVLVAGFVFGDMELAGKTIDGTFDAFFARLDDQGDLDFIQQVEGTSTLPRAATVLADGTFVVAGTLIGTATFGPGEKQETTLEEQGNQGDGFIARFDRSGDLVWARGVHGENSENLLGVATVEKVSAVLVGDFQGEVTFGADTANETTLTSDLDSRDGFFVRYGEKGEL